MPERRPPLPTFIIIGAQKSATRWLRFNLGAHPEIVTAPHEVKFFNHPKRMEALGTDWYRDQFETWAGEPITGESTPGYMMLRHEPDAVAARIQRVVPDVRLLALLRNPVDRANSALLHHKRAERIHPKTSLLDFVCAQPPAQDWMGVIEGGMYAASLEPYFRRFGDQVLVLLHDDLRANPRTAFDRARDHVGAEEVFFPAGLDEIVSSNQTDATHGVPRDDRRAVFELYQEDTERLEEMLGRDLSMWRPH